MLVNDNLQQASFAHDSRRESRNSRSGPQKREFQFDRRSHSATDNMETYRIDVGRTHQVQPGNIVGAIANEAGIGSESIGRIKIFDRFSTVDLPQGMPRGLLDSLQNVFVSGRKLRITRMNDSGPRPDRKQDGRRSFNKSKTKSKPKSKNRKKAAANA